MKQASAYEQGAIAFERPKVTRPAVKRAKPRIKPMDMLTSAIFIAVLAGGWRYPLLGYFIPFCMVMGMGMAFTKGRKWCGTLCPRGSFLDIAASRISPKKEIPAVFKGLTLRVGVLAFLLVMMTAQIILRWPDPSSIGMFFVMLLTITSVAALLLARFYHQRTWCYICPIGTLSKWAGTGKHELNIESSACVSCKLCTKACPMQVDPHSYKSEAKVADPDCIKCSACVSACPKKALKF